jgi:large exoprotein involved in heme utilization and adhesion
VTGNATPGVTYGGVHVKADCIEVLGTVSLEDLLAGTGDLSAFTGIRSDIRPGSTGGNSGNIKLDANSILINNFAQLETITESVGNAGNILIRANQNLDFDFAQVSSSSGTPFSVGATGDAGSIELTSAHGNISLTNISFITSQTILSPGTAGSITLNAPAGNILIADSILGTLLSPPNNPAGVPAVRAGGSGGILINANNLELQGGDIGIVNLSNLPSGELMVNVSGSLSLRGGMFFQSSIHALTQGPAPSAGLTITAHDILVTDGSSLTTSTISNPSGPDGPAGALNISADTVQVTNGGQISSATFQGIDPLTGQLSGVLPTGSAGTVSIQGHGGPAESVLIDGAGSGIFTNTQGTGAGGNINILANTLTVQNGGTLSAATSGTAPTATGGTILVKADTVTLTAGGTMTAASTGPGASGEVVVQGLASPAQSVLIDGAGSGIFTNTSGTGPGGDIHLSANSVTLQNGGTLSATTSGTVPEATGGIITVNANQVQLNSGGLITASTTGAGAGGSITIDAGTFASNAGIVSSTASQATGGDITITAGQSVTMTNGASISASSTGTGNAGSIHINAGQAFTATNSKVTTEADQASGGTIKITTAPSGTVQLTNSTISASVLDGTGGGGSVNIDPQSVILLNSQILAQAVQGPGGNISITTNLLLADVNSTISASSQFGQNGTIEIQSPISPASGKIVPLSQKPLIPTSLLSQRCAALAGGNFSSFTVAGRDSLPAEPGGWLSSPLAVSMSESGSGTLTEAGPRASLSEPGGEKPLLSLRQIAPPGFLTQAFAVDSSGCTS